MITPSARRLICACLLIGSMHAHAAAQTFDLEGTRENRNPVGPPSGRCVPPFFNTVTIQPGNISSTGQSNLGPFTSTQSHCIESQPPTPIREGRFEYTFRAGDSLIGTYDGQVSATGTPGLFNTRENLTITGGTGRFTGATGTITSAGTLSFQMGPVGVFNGTVTGDVNASATIASGDFATALGEPAAATGAFSTSIGAFSTATAARGVAVGSFAESTGTGAIAIGERSLSNALNSTAVGQEATAQGIASTAIGHNADATALASFAGGVSAQATNVGATALGRVANASGPQSTAIGAAAQATGEFGVALGTSAASTGPGAIAIGERSASNALNSTAVGQETTAQGIASTAIGHNADATGLASFAGGVSAQATNVGATALGRVANASAAQATALGAASQATFAGSTALGLSAATTAVNQVAIGGTGSSLRVGDIAASTAAQTGAVNVATVDAAGTLGQGAPLSSLATAAQVQALGTGQTALGGRVDELFDLRRLDRRDLRQGVAAAVAIGHAPMPSAPGRTSYVLNGALFRGEPAVGGSIMHRLGGANPLAVGIGFSFAGNKNNAFRAGIAGEF